jgi:hypothetical protein
MSNFPVVSAVTLQKQFAMFAGHNQYMWQTLWHTVAKLSKHEAHLKQYLLTRVQTPRNYRNLVT